MGSVIPARDPGPMARLEEVKRDVDAPAIIFERVADGEELRELAKSWALPKARFVEWFTTEHAGLYETALKVRADRLAHEALEDAAGATPETIGPAKLRVETKLKIASKWDRSRYGEQKSEAVQVVVNISDVPREIALLEERLGLRAKVVDALPAAVEAEPI